MSFPIHPKPHHQNSPQQVYVGNYDLSTPDSDIKTLVERFGNILKVEYKKGTIQT
jgi:hypothetical protein